MRFIAFLFFLPISLLAQVPRWDASFFTENGERFYVVVNAIRQNEVAQTNVKVTGLVQPNYKLKIVFEDGALGEVDGNIYAPMEPAEMVYNIKRDKKGVFRCRMFSATPLAQLPPPPPNQQVVTFTTEPRPVAVVPPPATVTQTTTTTTTTATPQTASVGVNIGGAGINMNVNISDPMLGGSAVQTTQTTTTTVRSNVSTTGTMVVDQGTIRSNDPPIVTRTPPPPPPVQQGCAGAWPMGESNFLSAMSSIKKQSFEDTRMKMAKQITSANCLTVNQIKRMMGNFSFEDSKLDYAKFAYPYCTDRNNYFQVNDLFSFSSSTDELTDFISQQQ